MAESRIPTKSKINIKPFFYKSIAAILGASLVYGAVTSRSEVVYEGTLHGNHVSLEKNVYAPFNAGLLNLVDRLSVVTSDGRDLELYDTDDDQNVDVAYLRENGVSHEFKSGSDLADKVLQNATETYKDTRAKIENEIAVKFKVNYDAPPSK